MSDRSNMVPKFIQQSSHPTACIFHILFKLLALLFFTIFGFFIEHKIYCYIVVLTLNAFDFWTVKNVSGRLMVGLRWWSEVQEDGSTTWKYEAKEVRGRALHV